MILTNLFIRFLKYVHFVCDRCFKFDKNFPSTPSHRYENIISLTIHYAWHVITRKIDVNYPDVQKKVLNSDRVHLAIETVSKQEYLRIFSQDPSANNEEYKKLIRKHRQRAFEHYMLLRSYVSSSLLRIAGWILYRLFSRVFTSIQFSKAQINQIRKKSEQNNESSQNVPILYLPLHRSQLDCILISFILSMNDISPPLVAVNDHFRIPFFSNLMRGLGAFFVKQKDQDGDNNLDEAFDNDEDPIYQAILKSYIIENLREGNSMEFFIENIRTCMGKVMAPKSGLLAIVLDALNEGSIQQVCVVPVSISYEKLIEGRILVDERLGINRSKETFFTTLLGIWTTLRSNFGTVRVDFGRPFILNEYVQQVLLKQQEQLQLEQEELNLDGKEQISLKSEKQINGSNQINQKNNNLPIKEEKNEEFPRKTNRNQDGCVACVPNSSPTTNRGKFGQSANSNFVLGNRNIKQGQFEKNLVNGTNNTIDNRNKVIYEEKGKSSVNELYNKLIVAESLAKHILHDAYHDSALMSTHLLSFILLNKYGGNPNCSQNGIVTGNVHNKAATIEQLAMDLDWLRQTICRDKQQQNISIIGDSFSCIRQAMHHLAKDDLIITEKVRLKWSSWNNQQQNQHQNSTNINSNNTSHHGQTNGYMSRNNHCQTSIDSNCSTIKSSSLNNGNSNNSSKMEIIYLKPSNKLLNRLHLQYYSNHCATLFQIESVLAMSLFSFFNTEYSHLIYDPSTFVSNLSINKQEFMHRCRSICSILQYEFIFVKNCQSLDEELEQTFEHSFVRRDLFVVDPSKPIGLTLPMSDVSRVHHYVHPHHRHHYSPSHKRRMNRPSPHSQHHHHHHKHRCLFNLEANSLQNECILEVDEDELKDMDEHNEMNQIEAQEPEEFYLRLTERNGQLLTMYKNILEPYMQAYWLVVDRLTTMANNNNLEQQQTNTKNNTHTDMEIQEKLFLKNLVQLSQKMAHSGSIHYECTSVPTFKNALRYLETIGAIRRKRRLQDQQQTDLQNDNSFSKLNAFKIKHENKSPITKTTPTSSKTLRLLFDKQQMQSLAQLILNFVPLTNNNNMTAANKINTIMLSIPTNIKQQNSYYNSY